MKTLKNYIKKRALFGFIAIVGVSLTACDDLLDTTSSTSLSAVNIFETPSRIEGLVNGTYKSLKNSSLYGGRLLLYSDVRGEDFINLTGNTYTAYESWNNSYSSGSNDISNLWSAGYSAINSANIIIEGLPSVNGVISEELKLQYIAEARLVRAVTYFSLVTTFAPPYNKDAGASKGLPLRLKAETTSANNDLARSTVKEIYDKIIEDLDYAEENLPQSYSTASLNTTRAHKNTAIALKTRVYLNKGDYANVVKEAKKIASQTTAPFLATTGVANALQTNILTIFESNYTTTESILSMPMTASDSYSGQSAIGYIYNVNSEYYLNPEGILNNSQWGASDARRGVLRQNGDRYFLKKYGKSSPYIDYIPVIRYAEVLLNYAEALARTGNATLAVELLKAVHLRSDASYVFPASSIDSEQALLNTIRFERRIEFLGEGFRSNDLLRELLPLPAKGSSSLQAAQVNPTDENYIFPLPNSEINTNKLLLD